MSTDFNWNALPADVLQRAFELQRDGLANCGAASSCVAWRNVARHSRVNNLELHSASDGQEQFWPRLLAARSCVDTLKLTSQRVCDQTNDIYTIHRSAELAEAIISSIPTACRSLSLSEFSAYGLEQYIGKSPEVQQLSMQWNGLQAGHRSFRSLPSFAPLHQLTQLTVHMRNDVNGDSFPCLVKSCPHTLESLILEGFGSTMEDEQPPVFAVRSLMLLEDNLPAVTRLELAQSVVRIPGEDITCLSKLKSLSLCDSEIYVDGQLEVTLLTDLTHLDLTGTTCFWEDAWVDALDAFTAWPSLAVFKVYNCNLFDVSTVMDVSTVREVHLGHFSQFAQPGPDQEAHVSTHVNPILGYDSNRAATIVGLAVDMCHDPFPGSVLKWLAAQFPLQSLSILKPPSAHGATESLDFSGADFPNLRHLVITGLYPSSHSVDLQSLSCLTSLELSHTDCCREVPGTSGPLKSVLLPFQLEVFTYVGSSLFLSSIKHNLQELPSLTKVTFQIDTAAYRHVQSFCLPQLPLGLQHLVLAGTNWCQPDCDWSGLRGCPNLQHLTLATGQRVSGQLEIWIRSARCLYIVDQSEDHHDQLTEPGEFFASRLPLVQ